MIDESRIPLRDDGAVTMSPGAWDALGKAAALAERDTTQLLSVQTDLHHLRAAIGAGTGTTRTLPRLAIAEDVAARDDSLAEALYAVRAAIKATLPTK